jgi:hypothetical protein
MSAFVCGCVFAAQHIAAGSRPGQSVAAAGREISGYGEASAQQAAGVAAEFRFVELLNAPDFAPFS